MANGGSGTPRVFLFILAGVLALGVLCAGGIGLLKAQDRACHREVAEVHVESEPVVRELAPLGRVSEVRWRQQIEGGKCDPGPGSLYYVREGIARIDPAQAVRLGERFPWDSGNIWDEDPEISSPLFLGVPPKVDWQRSLALDEAFNGSVGLDEATYFVDLDTGLVYFYSVVDYP